MTLEAHLSQGSSRVLIRYSNQLFYNPRLINTSSQHNLSIILIA